MVGAADTQSSGRPPQRIKGHPLASPSQRHENKPANRVGHEQHHRFTLAAPVISLVRCRRSPSASVTHWDQGDRHEYWRRPWPLTQPHKNLGTTSCPKLVSQSLWFGRWPSTLLVGSRRGRMAHSVADPRHPIRVSLVAPNPFAGLPGPPNPYLNNRCASNGTWSLSM